jgi:hypothetical protein
MTIKRELTVVFLFLEPLRTLRLCGEEFAAEAAPTALQQGKKKQGQRPFF